MRRPELLLFDLDGTLVDSAPDLAGTANDLRQHHGLPPLPYAQLRPMVGSGARGPVTKALQEAFFGIVRGEQPDRHRWLSQVPQPAPASAAATAPRQP